MTDHARPTFAAAEVAKQKSQIGSTLSDFAAKIRKVYEAEPYKGKGVRYVDEVVRRKAGKTVTK